MKEILKSTNDSRVRGASLDNPNSEINQILSVIYGIGYSDYLRLTSSVLPSQKVEWKITGNGHRDLPIVANGIETLLNNFSRLVRSSSATINVKNILELIANGITSELESTLCALRAISDFVEDNKNLRKTALDTVCNRINLQPKTLADLQNSLELAEEYNIHGAVLDKFLANSVDSLVARGGEEYFNSVAHSLFYNHDIFVARGNKEVSHISDEGNTILLEKITRLTLNDAVAELTAKLSNAFMEGKGGELLNRISQFQSNGAEERDFSLDAQYTTLLKSFLLKSGIFIKRDNHPIYLKLLNPSVLFNITDNGVVPKGKEELEESIRAKFKSDCIKVEPLGNHIYEEFLQVLRASEARLPLPRVQLEKRKQRSERQHVADINTELLTEDLFENLDKGISNQQALNYSKRNFVKTMKTGELFSSLEVEKGNSKTLIDLVRHGASNQEMEGRIDDKGSSNFQMGRYALESFFLLSDAHKVRILTFLKKHNIDGPQGDILIYAMNNGNGAVIKYILANYEKLLLTSGGVEPVPTLTSSQCNALKKVIKEMHEAKDPRTDFLITSSEILFFIAKSEGYKGLVQFKKDLNGKIDDAVYLSSSRNYTTGVSSLVQYILRCDPESFMEFWENGLSKQIKDSFFKGKVSEDLSLNVATEDSVDFARFWTKLTPENRTSQLQGPDIFYLFSAMGAKGPNAIIQLWKSLTKEDKKRACSSRYHFGWSIPMKMIQVAPKFYKTLKKEIKKSDESLDFMERSGPLLIRIAKYAPNCIEAVLKGVYDIQSIFKIPENMDLPGKILRYNPKYYPKFWKLIDEEMQLKLLSHTNPRNGLPLVALIAKRTPSQVLYFVNSLSQTNKDFCLSQKINTEGDTLLTHLLKTDTKKFEKLFTTVSGSWGGGGFLTKQISDQGDKVNALISRVINTCSEGVVKEFLGRVPDAIMMNKNNYRSLGGSLPDSLGKEYLSQEEQEKLRDASKSKSREQFLR